LTRASIKLEKILAKKMDGRVKPGHDETNHCAPDAAQRAVLHGVVRCRAISAFTRVFDALWPSLLV
jgi:hypothetical protein